MAEQFPLDLILLLGFASVAIGTFFLLFMLLSSQYRGASSRLVAVILAVLIYSVLSDTLIYSRLIFFVPYLFKFADFFDLALYPLLYLLVLSFDSHWEGFQRWHLLLFLPFLADAVYILAKYGFQDSGFYQNLLHDFYRFTRGQPANLFSNWKVLLRKLVVPIPFLLVAIIVLYKAKKDRLRPFLILLVAIFAFKLLADSIYIVYHHNTGNLFTEWVVNILFYASFLIVAVFITLRQMEAGEANPFKIPTAKYRGSALGFAAAGEFYQEVLRLMDSEQPYRDADFSIQRLAQLLETNSSYLSRVINETTGENFPQFVNHYRITLAKDMLEDPIFDTLTIDGIAAEAGFKSKSAFYRAFRQKTGLSPTAYKAQAGKNRPDS